MNRTEEFRFPSATGEGTIYCKKWIPQSRIRAVVQIIHGMAEHILRYEWFARRFNENGILVVGHDHAGHGKSLVDDAHKGFFAAQNGWDAVIADIKTLHDITKDSVSDVPYVLLGHSMGSFAARAYAARYQTDADGYIFSGTAGSNPAVGMGKLLAKIEMHRNGAMIPSKLLNSIAFGAYNKRFMPHRTPYDWLTRDEEQVDRYIEDPLCGFVFTAEGMYDLFCGMEEVTGSGWAKCVPKVPILLISGGEDPVGGYGNGVRQVETWLKKSGHAVKTHIYPGARHEMLNEINREQAVKDILTYLAPMMECVEGENI